MQPWPHRWPHGSQGGQGNAVVRDPAQTGATVPPRKATPWPRHSSLPNSLAHRCSTMASDFISLSQGGHTVVPAKRREEEVRSQLKTRCRTGRPRGGKCPGPLPWRPSAAGQHAAGAQEPSTSSQASAGHGRPPASPAPALPAAPRPAQAGAGSCQEREDGAGKERGFQRQALS